MKSIFAFGLGFLALALIASHQRATSSVIARPPSRRLSPFQIALFVSLN